MRVVGTNLLSADLRCSIDFGRWVQVDNGGVKEELLLCFVISILHILYPSSLSQPKKNRGLPLASCGAASTFSPLWAPPSLQPVCPNHQCNAKPKRRRRRNTWRLPETVPQLSSLLGSGWCVLPRKTDMAPLKINGWFRCI